MAKKICRRSELELDIACLEISLRAHDVARHVEGDVGDDVTISDAKVQRIEAEYTVLSKKTG